VARATVAENSSDGVVAPLFYLALGGVPLTLFYKMLILCLMVLSVNKS
jgi:cobalamin biosynthesis protein CobD/CbiB